VTARLHTGYSFRHAIGHLPDVMDRVKECGWPVAPITDRMSTFGFVRWTKACKEAGIRPAYGCEVACVPALGEKKPSPDWWAFLAKDALRPLHDIIYRSTRNPGKDPSLTYHQAVNLDGLIAIAGERVQLNHLPPAPDCGPDFFIALSPATPKGLIRQAKEQGYRFIASSCNTYPNESDLELYRVALGWRASTQSYPQHIMTDAELREWFTDVMGLDAVFIDQAFANRDYVWKQCNAVMRKGKLIKPERPDTLLNMCVAGAQKLGVDLTDPIYAERLTTELDMIASKDFEDYFYVLSDIVSWARKNMVVGPARGSAAGSLVCYLLSITAIDPIPYGLIFARFLDFNRPDPPDIDVDFSDTKRHLVFEYAEKKYGKDRVARLGTVGMFKARSALKQAGNALRIPPWKTDKLADSIIERSSGDSRLMNSLEDTLMETEAGRTIMREFPELGISARMEGHPNVASQHAAGLLLTDEPITEYVAMDARTRAAWCDKKDAEALNLLKIDALGLTQLSIFERLQELIGVPIGSSWFDGIPLDDPLAFEVLNKRYYSGIFQFTGTSLRSLSSQIQFTHLDDVIAMSALCRPGPLASGGAGAWVRGKQGEVNVNDIHPLLTELTKETFGVVVYQETVMRITREIGNFSWADTAKIRKLMSNSSGDEAFGRFEEQFMEGAQANGLSKEQATAIWKQIDSMGSWAFNKSHSVAYGIISYWCCYLKAHWPVEFAAATLDAESDPGKQLAMLREMAAEGIDYVPVDPERSEYRWTVGERDGRKILVGPLTAIKGIGPAKVREVMESRRTGLPLRPALAKQLANAKTEVDSLFPIADAVKALHPDLAAINIYTEPTPIVDVQPGIRGDVVIIGLLKKVSPRAENEEVNVQKRGGKRVTGPDQSINLFFEDDTGEIFCKVNRFQYERLAPKILEGKAGKSLFAIKGPCPASFRMVDVKAVRFLGNLP